MIILVLTAYMFITGFSPSVVRAGIMGIIMLGAGILHRKNDTWTSIALSIIIILIYNPFLICSLGVLLSYGGTIGIIVFNRTIIKTLEKLKVKDKRFKYKINKKMEYIINGLKEILAVCISAQIVIMPIICIIFNTVNITFILTNILLGLIIGPIVIIGFIAILFSFIPGQLLKIVSFVLSPMLQMLIVITNFASKIPLHKIYIPTPNCLQITAYYIVIIILNYIYKIYLIKNPNSFQYRIRNLISLFKYKLRQNRKKVISFILIICIVFSLVSILPNELKIYFIDVGQRRQYLNYNAITKKYFNRWRRKFRFV